MSTLGVVVLSLSGMKHLDRCLESVRWADAIGLFHVGSGEPAIRKELLGSLAVKRIGSINELQGQDMGTDWVLFLWGEEQVGTELEEELRGLCQTGLSGEVAYRIPVRSYLLGCWAEGSLWGPSPSPRLCRGMGAIASGWRDNEKEQRGEGYGRLRGWIGDYSCAELKEGWDRLQEISRLWAERWVGSGEGAGPFSMTTLSLRIFLRLLWANGLWGNGLAGLTLPTLAAYGNLLSGAKAWEAQRAKTDGRP